ncbi:hypothetical protein CHU00_10200 [Sphingobacterium cellulitidis]|uniref:hypothetical protein n=1 Tax=Sphingobacterium cellulitidis TaxID=1768011 RepID=UPI000B93FC21|nr:hypothetical protein [Sphingobacterium cellulitidis]OYD45709.1 hypothetical protein CHU00_10200 [Sphingobacterium cellulitidis]
MRTKVTNFDELTAEIARLKIQKKEQEAFLLNQYDLLKHKVEAPARIANMIFKRVPGVSTIKGLVSGIGQVTNKNNKADWLTKALQLGLPLVLNRTLLKNAGWLKKGLVLFGSETVASQVNQSKVTAVIDKLTSFIKPKKKKKKKVAEVEAVVEGTPIPPNHPPMITAEESVQDNMYGIPKDSEAY